MTVFLGRWQSPKLFCFVSIRQKWNDRVVDSLSWSLMVAEIDPVSTPATRSLTVFEGGYWSLQKVHSCFHIVVDSFWRNFKFSNDRKRPLTTIWKPGFKVPNFSVGRPCWRSANAHQLVFLCDVIEKVWGSIGFNSSTVDSNDWKFGKKTKLTVLQAIHNGPYSSFRLETRFWRHNDKTKTTLVSQQMCFSRLEDTLYRLKEILWQNFVFIEGQWTEILKASVCCHGNNFFIATKMFNKSCFAYCIN